MRFNADAYNQIFPRVEEVTPVETVVDTFRPTEEIEQGEQVSQIPPTIELGGEEENEDGN